MKVGYASPALSSVRFFTYGIPVRGSNKVVERVVELTASSIPFSDDLEPPPLWIFTQKAVARLTATLIVLHPCFTLGFHSLFNFLPFSSNVIALRSPPHLCSCLGKSPRSQWLEPYSSLCRGRRAVSRYSRCKVILQWRRCVPFLALYTCTTPVNPDRTHSCPDFIFHIFERLLVLEIKTMKLVFTLLPSMVILDLLILFLACDTTGTIREFKNSQGYVLILISQ